MTSGVRTVLFLISALLACKFECGRICLSCTDVNSAADCLHIATCQQDEVCFVQKYQNQGSQIRYDVGCAYTEMCVKDLSGNIIGKRYTDHSHVLCQRCCNNTDICNARLECDNVLEVPKQTCLSCSGVADDSTCQNTTTCNKDELCLHGSTSYVFGRRSTDGRHLVCETCCGGKALCNNNFQCHHHSQSQFNARCNSTIECTSNLLCLFGRCSCASNDFFWNSEICTSRKSVLASCTENSQCQHSLNCTNRVCQCESTEYWNGTMCLLRKSLNTTCLSLAECSETLFCIKGICKCDSSTDYWNGSFCSPIAQLMECADLSVEMNGVYIIYPLGSNHPVFVYCIVDNGTTWTVIQKRFDGVVNLNRTWQEYRAGFGSVYGEFWLGNDYIHAITSKGRHELSITMEFYGGSTITTNCSTFSVGNYSQKFTLTCAGYSGVKGLNIWMQKLNGQQFTTKDEDNDNSFVNCAEILGGGWWYNNECVYADVNGRYSTMMLGDSHIEKTIIKIKRTI